jgi:PRC-barrel domain protein
MNHPRPGLRYVDARDLDNSQIKFDRMDVQGLDGEQLGTVDGFIIDKSSVRPYYVVVNAGGWFKSKYFLLPVGHVGLEPSEQRLVADMSRDRVDRYPGFDRGEFEKLSEDDLKMMDDQMWSVCCIDATIELSSLARYDDPHYRQPNWWDSSFYRPDRADAMGKDIVGTLK